MQFFGKADPFIRVSRVRAGDNRLLVYKVPENSFSRPFSRCYCSRSLTIIATHIYTERGDQGNAQSRVEAIQARTPHSVLGRHGPEAGDRVLALEPQQRRIDRLRANDLARDLATT